MKRTVAFLTSLGLVISGIAVLFMIFLITIEVVGRRVLGFSTLVADEFSGYLLVIITFMGAAYTLKTGGFTRMEAVYNRFKGRGRWIIDLAFNLASFLFLVIIDYWLWMYILSNYRSGLTSISILQTPLYIPQLFMGVGGILLAIEVFLQIISLFIPWKAETSGGHS